MTEKQHDVIVVIVPLAAQGHLHQCLELARRLSSPPYNIPVYFVGTTVHVRQAQSRARGWDPLTTPNLNFSQFSVPFEVPPPNPDAFIKFPSHLVPAFNSTLHLRQPVAELVNNLASTARKVAVIHDFLTNHVVQDVPKISNAECYCFFAGSASVCFSYIWDAAKTHVPPEAEVVLKQMPSLDGCFAPELDDFVAKQLQTRIYGCGDVYDTSSSIEGLYLDLMEKTYTPGYKHWAIGPFNPVEIETDGNKKRHFCLEWLDKQPPKSVVFVSFGSTTSLSEEEFNELGKGLEQSGERFIWVLRDADKGDIFDGNVRKYELPEGYEERISERGLVVSDWAPQLEILGHPSTGGFMSHCGWNSCLESISMGVPIAAWPMHSDQPRNAVMITQGFQIGITVRDWERRNEIVPAETIVKAVKTLINSPEIKQRAAELRVAVKSAVKKGGATHKEMESFVAHITR